MDSRNRVVTKTPLKEIWDERGALPARRVGSLTVEEIEALLGASPVEFVIADVGFGLQWIAAADVRGQWKASIRRHIAHERAYLEDFPDGFCYFASRWEMAGRVIVVLEKSH